ncbi:MAG: HNH endonuclease signature motif containing protein [Methylocystis sp.]|uniref:HNH endonuclease signature motif containing protein n=1 Tax=Methylocystis sp. TaxID=1911079 RepID=UPI003DA22A58
MPVTLPIFGATIHGPDGLQFLPVKRGRGPDRRPRRRKPTRSPEVRFWEKVIRGDGCWEWTAAKSVRGYGTFGLRKGKMVPAHRMSWELTYGKIPDGLIVCHHCDNPECVRPDHLFLGTYSDNTQDMIRKGRGGIQKHLARKGLRRNGTPVAVCKRGHPSVPENRTPSGNCRPCSKIHEQRRPPRRKGAS